MAYRPPLTKQVNRLTTARRHEQGKTRQVIVSLAPPASVGFRLSGTRQTYWLDVEVAYEVAVKRYRLDLENLARKIAKQEAISKVTARRYARQRLSRGVSVK